MREAPKDLLDWLNLRNSPDWAKARWLGGIVGVLIAFLFIMALVALVAVLLHTIGQAFSPDGQGPNLGAGALIAALLGAPFVIWATVLKHQTVRYQKEGHITDRINKAVEMLGAEKTVKRIGRPVTIWTGEPEAVYYDADTASNLAGNPRTRLSPKEWHEAWNHEDDEMEEGYRQSVTTWPVERTVIQWQGETLTLDKDEVIGSEGSWQVFKETFPNIEIRIGAILSLERIAQDSTAFDKVSHPA